MLQAVGNTNFFIRFRAVVLKGGFRIFLYLFLVPIMAFINVYRRLIIRVEIIEAERLSLTYDYRWG
jgi:hypothetical protein